MIDRSPPNQSSLNLFKPVKSESGIIELPNIPGMVESNAFQKDGRVIAVERVPEIKEAIDQILGKSFNESEEHYIHRSDFPEELNINNSFIRIGTVDYVVIKQVIGKGQQENTVLLAQNIETGELGVLKKIMISGTEEEQKKVKTLVERETEALHAIENSPKTPIRKKSKKEIKYAYIFMQLAKGIELTDLLEKERSRDGMQKTFLCRPMISPLVRIQLGLNLIQQEINLAAKEYWHLDLKPRNVMVDLSKQIIKLIDFGMSRRMNADKNVVLAYVTGTDIILPPEIRALAASEPASAASVLLENKTSISDSNKGVTHDQNSEVAEEKTSLPESEGVTHDQKSEVAEEKTTIAENPEGVTYNEKSEVYALGLILAELYGLYDIDAAYDCHGQPLEEWLDTAFVNPDTSANNEFFSENRSMPRAALLEVLQLVLDMTADETKRIDLAESFKRLEGIKNKYFAKAVVKIGVIDVAEYVNLNADEKKAFLKQFAEVKTFTDDKKRQWQERAVDEILLVDSSGTAQDVFFYLNVKREIEKAFEVDDPNESDDYFNLVVANEVITPHQDSLNNMTKYLQDRDLPTQCVPVKSPHTEQEAKTQIDGPGKSSTGTKR